MNSRLPLCFALASGLLLASASARAGEPEAYGPQLAPPIELPSAVLVHVSSKGAARLERREVGERWIAVCDAPCDRELPLADDYRIAYGTKGQTAGPPFRLRPASGAVELKVHPSSVGGQAGGTVLVVLGSAVALVSGLGLLVGISLAAQPDTPCHTDWCIDPHPVGGALALLSGLGLLMGAGVIVGGTAIIEDAKGKTTQRPWSGREPTWVGPQATAPKKAGFVPLSFSF
jgi:hypothetical protein